MRRRFVITGLVFVAVSGIGVLMSAGGGLSVSEEDVAQALADGSGAAVVAVGPTSLEGLERIGERAAVEAARDTWLARLEEGSDSEGELCVLLSAAHRRLRETDEALRYAERGVELLPLNGRAHHTLARALAQKMQASSKLQALMAIGGYKKSLANAIELDPSNGAARKEQILMLAFAPKPVGDRARAIELARAFIEQDPVLGSECLARALAMGDDQEAALQLLRDAIAENPAVDDLRWVLGTLLERAELRDEADAEYALLLTGTPGETYYQALFQRAKMRVEGDYELEVALECLDRYLAEDPYWEWAPRASRALELRGRALEGLDRKAEALAAFEAALELDPDFQRAADGALRVR